MLQSLLIALLVERKRASEIFFAMHRGHRRILSSGSVFSTSIYEFIFSIFIREQHEDLIKQIKKICHIHFKEFSLPGSCNDDSNDGSWGVDVGDSLQGECCNEHNDDGSSEEQHDHRVKSQNDRGYRENEHVSQQELYSESDGCSEGQMDSNKEANVPSNAKNPFKG